MYSTLSYCTLLYCTVWLRTLYRHCSVLCVSGRSTSSVLYCTVLYSTLLYRSVLYCVALDVVPALVDQPAELELSQPVIYELRHCAQAGDDDVRLLVQPDGHEGG